MSPNDQEVSPRMRRNKKLLDELTARFPAGMVSVSDSVLMENSRDFGQLADEPMMPLAVVFPTKVGQVQELMQLASEHRLSVISRGAGTGVSGAVHVTDEAIILNLSKMNRIIEIRPQDEVAVVEPGVINHHLNLAVSEFGLMYAPDPASYKMSTIGGNIATNAGGLRCAK